MHVWSLSREDHLEEGMETHFNILAWRISWMEVPARLQFLGSQRIRHDWNKHAHIQEHFLHVFKSCKKIIINRILWNMKIICKSKLGVPEEGFISMPSWSLICVLSTTVFMLQQQCWEAALATVWLSKIKLFRSFPFRGKKIGRPPYYTSGFQTWVCTRTSWVTWSTQMLSLISRGHNLAGFGVTWASHF